MVRWMSLLAAGTALAGCSAAPPPEVAAPAAPAEAVVPVEAPKPMYGTFGFDETGMDKTVLPGDNFYEYANGTWAKNTPIPADKSNYGAFNLLQDKAQADTRGIIEEAAKDPSSKIGVAYNSYLDTAGIEAKGIAPIQPWLNEIKGLKAKSGYAALVAKADRNGVGVPFGSYVGQDDKDPDTYAMNLFQGGLGMPDRDYYLSSDAKLAETKAAYENHLANVLTLAELAKKAPGFDFAGYLSGIGAPNLPYILIAQPSALAGIANLIGKTPIGVLKDQLLVRSIEEYSDVLPAAFDREQFAFYSNVLSGIPQQQERWKRATDFTIATLTDDISKLYVAKYFPPETKKAADEMVANIIAAMGRRIDALDWMSAEAKARAHEKLANFTPRIGYPSQWHDYASLEIVAGDALGNNLRANNWKHDDNISKLGTPIRRWDWGLTPMTINAQANPTLVAITFPAAIMQPPFFDPNADPAVNYGGMGAVIGHELSHHFDDQGAKYDMHGRLADWWTPADVAAFKVRTDALAAQYDAYEPLPGMHVKGAFTLGENSADLAGLSVAYDAYKAALGGKEAPMLDGFSGDQRFYLGWAQVWRRNYREANLRQRLLTDPHAPSEQRTWVVRNLDPWYPAYNVQPGQKLYLAPEKRVRMW